MKQKNLNIDDITMDANSLEGAINGLASFMFHNVSTDTVKIEDISALNGLVASIQLLAKKHATELSDYGMEL